ncbi:FxsA family protein [Tessaracoccus sp. Z1128]
MAVRRGAFQFGLMAVTVFVLVFAEIGAILWVAGEIGWWTLAILLATTLLGIYLLQREWRKAWGALAEALRSGELPSGRLADASLILVGGVLLVLPGLLTDVLGLLLLLPFTRPFVRSAIVWWASKTIQRSGAAITVIKGDVAPHGQTLIPGIDASEASGAGHDTIRGEIVEDDNTTDRGGSSDQ